MRRYLIVALMLTGMLVGNAAVAPPAQALTVVSDCHLHEGPDGAGGDSIKVCISVQERLCCGADAYDLRALVHWSCGGCRPEIRVDFSRLQRNVIDGVDKWATLREASHMTWTRTYLTNQLAETGWSSQCPTDRDAYWRATASYQLKWYGDPTGWFTRGSGSFKIVC